jgi:AcrR family transcriptional regulator
LTESVARVDRRVRRTTAALQRALIELTLEKGYTATTIEDITSRADVARATFYAHYADKQALLTSIAADLTEDIDARVTPRAPVSTATIRGEAVLEMFRHAADHRDAYRVLLSGAGDPPAYQALIESLAASAATVFALRCRKQHVKPRLPIEFLARIWVGEHVSLLAWWLLGDLPYTPEQMALMRTRYDVYGQEWAHGFSPGQWTFDESAFGPHDELPAERRRRSTT